MLAQEADRVAHVLGTGRAVEADHIDLERLQRGQDRADVGSEQHLAAVGQQRHAALDRHRPVARAHRLARAEDGGLDLEDVLGGLDDDQVRAAFEQATGLLGEDRDELAEADLAERRVIGRGQKPGGADRAGHEAILTRGATSDLGRLDVDLVRVILKAPLRELESRRLEGVGLQHVRSGVQHRVVQLLDHVRAVEHQRLVATPGQAVVVLQAQIELLQGGAHAAVKDDCPVADRGEVVTHPGDGSPTLTNLWQGWRRAFSGRWPGGGVDVCPVCPICGAEPSQSSR